MQPIMPSGSSSNRKDLEGKPQDDLSLGLHVANHSYGYVEQGKLTLQPFPSDRCTSESDLS
jgi:hypothetical protein